jgi:hypothetical protein
MVLPFFDNPVYSKTAIYSISQEQDNKEYPFVAVQPVTHHVGEHDAESKGNNHQYHYYTKPETDHLHC